MAEPRSTKSSEPAKNTFSDKLTQDPSEHMEAMGAAKGKGKYSAMPPSQHRSFLDPGQSEENRLHAAIWQRVIVPNAQDWTLAAFARESNEAKTPTGVQHLADATGITPANVSSALKRLEARGIISIQKKPFRIYLCYNVPAPKAKEATSGANKERTIPICTDSFNARELAYLERFQDHNSEQFRAWLPRIVGQMVYDAERLADSTAWSREREAEEWEQRFMEIAYTEKDPRGRTRKRPASNPEHFKPKQTFEEFFAQNEEEMRKLAAPISVRNGQIILHTDEQNSEQKPPPYGLTHHSLTEDQLASQGRSNAKPEAREAELTTKAARTEIKTELNALVQKHGLRKMGASPIDVSTLERMAGEIVKLDSDVLRHEIYAVVDDKCSEYKTGKSGLKDPAKWPGYLYVVIREEVGKLLKKTDVREQLKDAATAMSMPGKAKSAKAGQS